MKSNLLLPYSMPVINKISKIHLKASVFSVWLIFFLVFMHGKAPENKVFHSLYF